MKYLNKIIGGKINLKAGFLLAIGAVVGIILIYMGSSSSDEKKADVSETEKNEISQMSEYVNELERRVAEIIEYMDGVTDVHVIITPENAGETVYAQNGSYDKGTLTQKEYVITDVNGDEKLIKIKLVFPKIRGIAVVCKGCGNPINQEKIVSLLSALFELSSNRVYVIG